MTVWMIFVQEVDEATWLEAAWDDEMTALNYEGWQKEVDRVRRLAADNHYEMRILRVEVPGVFDAFDIPVSKATDVEVVE
jgi:hypothetical protein